MAQLSLYIEDDALAELREDANANGQSISSYARSILKNRHASERERWENGWPPGYFDLFGSSPDFPAVPDLAPAPAPTW